MNTSTSPRVVLHAARRWATAVAAVIESPTDPRTLHAWARFVGTSASSLRAWCQAARVPPKNSLDCARLLRATVLSRTVGWDPVNLLDIRDYRTLRQLLRRGGLHTERAPDQHEFISRQILVTDPVAKQELIAIIDSRDQALAAARELQESA